MNLIPDPFPEVKTLSCAHCGENSYNAYNVCVVGKGDFVCIECNGCMASVFGRSLEEAVEKLNMRAEETDLCSDCKEPHSSIECLGKGYEDDGSGGCLNKRIS